MGGLPLPPAPVSLPSPSSAAPTTTRYSSKLVINESEINPYVFQTLIYNGTSDQDEAVRTMLDTGSDVELISSTFVNRNGLSELVTATIPPMPITGIGGFQTLATEEIELDWKLTRKSATRKITCYLIEVYNTDFDLLLGSVFLHTHGLLVVQDPGAVQTRPLVARVWMNIAEETIIRVQPRSAAQKEQDEHDQDDIEKSQKERLKAKLKEEQMKRLKRKFPNPPGYQLREGSKERVYEREKQEDKLRSIEEGKKQSIATEIQPADEMRREETKQPLSNVDHSASVSQSNHLPNSDKAPELNQKPPTAHNSGTDLNNRFSGVTHDTVHEGKVSSQEKLLFGFAQTPPRINHHSTQSLKPPTGTVRSATSSPELYRLAKDHGASQAPSLQVPPQISNISTQKRPGSSSGAIKHQSNNNEATKLHLSKQNSNTNTGTVSNSSGLKRPGSSLEAVNHHSKKDKGATSANAASINSVPNKPSKIDLKVDSSQGVQTTPKTDEATTSVSAQSTNSAPHKQSKSNEKAKGLEVVSDKKHAEQSNTVPVEKHHHSQVQSESHSKFQIVTTPKKSGEELVEKTTLVESSNPTRSHHTKPHAQKELTGAEKHVPKLTPIVTSHGNAVNEKVQLPATKGPKSPVEKVIHQFGKLSRAMSFGRDGHYDKQKDHEKQDSTRKQTKGKDQEKEKENKIKDHEIQLQEKDEHERRKQEKTEHKNKEAEKKKGEKKETEKKEIEKKEHIEPRKPGQNEMVQNSKAAKSQPVQGLHSTSKAEKADANHATKPPHPIPPQMGNQEPKAGSTPKTPSSARFSSYSGTTFNTSPDLSSTDDKGKFEGEFMTVYVPDNLGENLGSPEANQKDMQNENQKRSFKSVILSIVAVKMWNAKFKKHPNRETANTNATG